MAMRMLTIFVALIVCGMFFPGLARGEDLSSDQGLDVRFDDVLIGEEKTIPLTITNQSSESTFTLILLLNMDAACEFTYTGPNLVSGFAPGDTLDVQVAFKPSAVGVCNAVLQIQYFGSGGLVEINFTGNGIEEVSETFIEIGGFDTGVLDRPMDEHSDSTLGEMIGECEATAYTCGQLLQCVSRLTWKLRKQKSITSKEMHQLRKGALRAEIRKIVKARKTSVRSTGGRFRYGWRHSHH